MNTLTIILGIVGLLGTIGTFYFGFKTLYLEKRRRSFSWQEVQTGTSEFLKEIIEVFKPDALVSMSGPGSIIANLGMSELKKFYPLYTLMMEDLKNKGFSFKPKGYETITTTKWRIHIPKQLLNEKDKKILILDECTMSGDTNFQVKKFLVENGHEEKNIYHASLVCSEVANFSNKAPNKYWYLNPHSEFYFPWGRWL